MIPEIHSRPIASYRIHRIHRRLCPSPRRSFDHKDTMKGSLIFFLGCAAAAVLPRINDVPSHTAAARPGAIVERQQPTGTATATWISRSNNTSTSSGSATTAAPTLPAKAAGAAADITSSCTPRSTCRDLATMMDCGSGLMRKRYGGSVLLSHNNGPRILY